MDNIKKRNLLLAFAIIFFGLLIAGGSLAYFTWRSDVNNIKHVSFNTSKDLQEYIVYDEGDSRFIGDFGVSSNYYEGIHTTVSIYKKQEAANIDLYATIYLRINSISSAISDSHAVKWVLTKGDETSRNVITSGNFYGTSNNQEIALKNFIEVTTTEEEYTVWIWLDGSEIIPSNLTGETLDTSVYTQVDQIQVMEEDRFEITRISAYYQLLSATVINNKNAITSYAVTKSSATPATFNSVNDSYVYCNSTGDTCNLEDYAVSDGTGTYYVWFKDSQNNIINRQVSVSEIDSTGPSCTWGAFSKSNISNGETAEITLTCTDEIGFKNSNILASNIVTSVNGLVTIALKEKKLANRGYDYTFTLTGTSGNGTTTLTLPANTISNKVNLGNAIATSGGINVYNAFTITLNKGEGTSAGTTSITATYNSSTISPSTITLARKSYTISGFTLGTTAGGASVSSTSTLTSSAPLNGYYTASSGGNKVLNANTTATFASNVSGYTDANGKWIRTSGETLYAQFGAQPAKTLPTITKSGYTCGWSTSSSATTITYASGASVTPSDNMTLYGVCGAVSVTVSLSSTSGTLTYGTNATSTITTTGTGNLSCSSSDSTVATCSISGNTLTITPAANSSDGKTATITVTYTGNNGTVATATYNATVNRKTITCPASPSVKTYNAASQGSGVTCPSGSTAGGTQSATSAGTYSHTCTANSGYKFANACSVSWTINPYNLSNATISGISNKEYTGSAITQAPTVKVPIPSGATTTLVNNTDYTYATTNNTNVGTATITVTGKSGSNYTGTKTATFSITAANAVCPTLTAYSGTYDGSAHSISVSGGSGGTIQYRTSTTGTWSATKPSITNVSDSPMTTYVQVAGDSNHSTVDCGSKTVTISKATPTISLYSVSSGGSAISAGSSRGSITYGGNVVTYASPSVAGKITASSSSTTYVTVTPTSTSTTTSAGARAAITASGAKYTTTAQTITVTLTPTDTANYDSVTTTYKHTVEKAAGSVSLSPASGTLTFGTNATSTISRAGDGTISCSSSDTSVATCSVSGTTLTITPVANNTDGKTATITVSVGAGTNHTAASATYNATVNRKTLTCPSSPSAKTYSTRSQNSGVTCPTNSTAGGTQSATNAGTYSHTCTPNIGYKFASLCSVSWTINPLDLGISNVLWGSIGDQAYTGSAITPTTVLGLRVASNQIFPIDSENYTYSYSDNINAGTATITATGKNNCTGTKTTTFKITPMSLGKPTNLAVSTSGVVTWDAVPGATSYQISIDNTNWTTASSGVNYNSTITANTGSRTVYVRALTTNTNYDASDTTSSKSVNVYSITLNSDGHLTNSVSNVKAIEGSLITLDNNNALHINNTVVSTASNDDYGTYGWIDATNITGLTANYSFSSGMSDNGSIIQGPNVTLEAGDYISTFTGNGLDNDELRYDIVSGSTNIPIDILINDNSTANLYFTLDQSATNVENRILYDGTSVSFTGLKIQRVMKTSDTLTLNRNLSLKSMSIPYSYEAFNGNHVSLGKVPTLKKAYDLIDTSAGTIEVLYDVKDGSPLEIENGRYIIIGTDDKTLTRVGGSIYNYGSLEIIDNGTITSNYDYDIVVNSGDGALFSIRDDSSVNIDFAGSSHSVLVFHDGAGGELSGGTITSNSLGIFSDTGSSITANGIEIYSTDYAVQAIGSTLDIASGTFVSSDTAAVYIHNNEFDHYYEYNIDGGQFEGTTALSVVSDGVDYPVNVNITGGAFIASTYHGIAISGAGCVTEIGYEGANNAAINIVGGSGYGVINSSSTLKIKSGTVSSSYIAVNTSNTTPGTEANTNISGGTFSGNQHGMMVESNGSSYPSIVTITGGNISADQWYGTVISGAGSVVNVGSPSTTVPFNTNPVIIGGSGGYSVGFGDTAGTWNFYSGILKSLHSTYQGVPSNVLSGYYVTSGTETIGGSTYNTSYLETLSYSVAASVNSTSLTCTASVSNASLVGEYQYSKCDATTGTCDSSFIPTSSDSYSYTTGLTSGHNYYCRLKVKNTLGTTLPAVSSSSVTYVSSIINNYVCNTSGNNSAYTLVYTGNCSISNNVIKFTNDGTLYVNSAGVNVDTYCVGGGGGGGANHATQALGAGGGGGGYTAKSSSVTLSSGTTYNVIIGAGGARGTKGSSSTVPTDGGAGNPSCIYAGSLGSCPDSSSAIIRADGGLGGKKGYSSIPGAGGAGGSGGGAGGKNYGSGNNGGNGGSGGLNGSDNNGSTASGGTGQGGAYQIGLDGVEYAGGGGGGGGYNDKYPGSGGLLGGGKGGYQTYSTYTAAIAGTANTGGGGGGAGGSGRDGAAGGSGICMIQQK